MSRSNPHESTPNPAVRWFEWNGEAGTVRYYDKDAKQNVDVGSKFSFMLLDQLGSVGGFNEPSNSWIYSNQVKFSGTEPLVVKSKKGGVLAEGLYKDIKERVTSKGVGGQFVQNCYVAFKDGDDLSIGCMRFKGAALGAWMDFSKANRAQLYKKAIAIDGYLEGKKGRITFRVPVLKVMDVTPESNNRAVELDEEFQAWLEGYLNRGARKQAEQPTPHDDYSEDQKPEPVAELTDDDIPF